MNRTELLRELESALPVTVGRAKLPAGDVGLVVVDAVVGFTRTGCLADPVSMAPMVEAIDRLARDLRARLGDRLHVLILRDRHAPDIPEPPYPPHCIVGTGEERMDPALAWLETEPDVAIVDKDCINGFVGSMRSVPAADGPPLHRNLLLGWARERRLRSLVLVGDCTDICVSDLTVALLSARNHGLLTDAAPSDRAAYVEAITAFPIVVFTPGCATYDFDPEEATPLRHPRALAHHVGLWVCTSRGALLADGLDLE
jgi:nicotinamidase-related amidase